MKKGEQFEKEFSLRISEDKVPILISPMLLRSKNLGQIDMAYLSKKDENKFIIHLIELKIKNYPERKQIKRLIKAGNYLGEILNMEVKFEVIFCQNKDRYLFF